MELAKSVKRNLNKLNTKGCCFLCLKINIDNGEVSSMKSAYMGNLLRHLQIGKGLKDTALRAHTHPENIEAELCAPCEKIISRFSILSLQLEKLQIEINFYLERIHQCISKSTKAPQLVQVYSKRMTSDIEALAQLAFVDNLRKYVGKKSLTSQKNIPSPRISLRKEVYQKQVIKEEANDASEITEETFTDSPSPSPPPSPSLESAASLPEVKFEIKNEPSSIYQEDDEQPALNTHSERPNTKSVKDWSQFYRKDPVTGMFQCKSCDKKSRHSVSIGNHFETVHLKKVFKCDLCKVKTFTHMRSLRRHRQNCQQTLEQEAAFKFICKLCGKRFKRNQVLLQHHQNVHRNVNRYPCDLCDKKFKSPAHLKEHKDVVHFGKTFSCKFCVKTFRSRSAHAKHEHAKSCQQQKVRVEDIPSVN